MKIFWYRISLGLSFWFFMSPFLIKTAATLQGRAAGILIGLWLIICSYYGLRNQGAWSVRGIVIGGIACMVWGLVGGKIMHFGGTFHDLLLGLLFLVVAWLISRVPENSPCECCIDNKAVLIGQIRIENDELVCYTDKKTDAGKASQAVVRIPFASLITAGALIPDQHCFSLVRGLIRTANRLHKRR